MLINNRIRSLGKPISENKIKFCSLCWENTRGKEGAIVHSIISHLISNTKTDRLTPFLKIIAVCSGNHVNHVDIVFELNTEFLVPKTSAVDSNK
jgi:hypothetical protein